VRLHPAGDGVAPASGVLVGGLDRPQGVAVATRHGRSTLVVGESSRIDRYPLRGAVAGRRATVRSGLPSSGLHFGKFVAVGADARTVFYGVGTARDDDPADRLGRPMRGTIAAVRLDGTHRRTLAVGVRNGEGLSIAPDGTLFAAVNQVNASTFPFHRPLDGLPDAFGTPAVSWTTDNPPDQVTRIRAGSDLGWPFCTPDSTRPAVAGTLLGLPFVPDAVNNPTGRRLDCTELAPTQVGLPGHSAPIGFHFLGDTRLPRTLRGGALVVAHGSYQRVPPREPAVRWMPWRAGSRTLGSAVDLVTGFQNADGTRWARPVDAVAGPDGALYVSDDTNGLVYRMGPAA
jgi:glucose/arabinose dehydrogenase